MPKEIKQKRHNRGSRAQALRWHTPLRTIESIGPKRPVSISPKRVPDGERIPSAVFYTPLLPPKPRTEPRDHCPASSHTVCRRPQRCPMSSTTQMHCACSQYHIRNYGTEAERSCGLSLRRPSASSGGHHMQLQHTYLSNLLAFPVHRCSTAGPC